MKALHDSVECRFDTCHRRIAAPTRLFRVVRGFNAAPDFTGDFLPTTRRGAFLGGSLAPHKLPCGPAYRTDGRADPTSTSPHSACLHTPRCSMMHPSGGLRIAPPSGPFRPYSHHAHDRIAAAAGHSGRGSLPPRSLEAKGASPLLA